MKRWRELSIFMAILLLSMCFSFQSLAESKAEIKIEIGSPNSTGAYPVIVTLSKNTDVEMIQFTLGYDSEKLELLSYAVGNAFIGKTAPTLSNPSNGTVCFVWDALAPLNDGGTLLTLEVKPRSNASGAAQLWFNYDEDFVFADANYQQVAIEAQGTEIDLGALPATSPLPTATSGTDIEGYNNGLNLNDNELSLAVGEDETLTVSGENGALAWSSSNESVATVENGRVTAISSGTAIISVSSADGTKDATCVVLAADEPGSGLIGNKNLVLDSIKIIVVIALVCIVIGLLIITLRKRNK